MPTATTLAPDDDQDSLATTLDSTSDSTAAASTAAAEKMVIAGGNDHLMNVPAEATAFLGAVAAFVVLLLVFFLYLNKKWCFYGVGGFPCCDEPLGRAARAARSKHLGRAYSYEEPDSSSDSEEEVLRRLQQSGSLSLSSAQLRDPPSPGPGPGPGPGTCAGTSQRDRTLPPLERPKGGGGGGGGGGSGSGSQQHSQAQQQDLISLAEKGKVGSSSASSSCSTTSGDDEGHGGGKALRHRGADATYKLLCSVDALEETPAVAGPAPRSFATHAHAHAHGHAHPLAHHSSQPPPVPGHAPLAASRAPPPPLQPPPPPAQPLPVLPPPPQQQHHHQQLQQHQQHQHQQHQQHQHQHQQQQHQQNHEASSQDCVVVLPQEQLFGVATSSSSSAAAAAAAAAASELGSASALSGGVDVDVGGGCAFDAEAALVSRCGHLEVAFAYDAPIRTMTVRVLQARDVPARDRGGAAHAQVRLLLLPSKKQKHKTKIRSGDSPQFLESFLLHRVNPEDVNSMGVRFRLYGCERMRRERMIGEAVVSFASLNLELETTLWLALEPRANLTSTSVSDLRSLARSDSTGSTQSMQHGGVPELLLGLAYNGTTGRLSVEVVKGSHFRNLAMTRAPDTYVKLCLVSSSGQEMARSKTSVRRGQPNPLFKETFMFQVALFQLPDVTLMVSVYNKRSMKRKEMIGWFSLGLNSSGEEELAHWNDMRDVRGEQISRWHVLVES